jgi:hypothetical protein
LTRGREEMKPFDVEVENLKGDWSILIKLFRHDRQTDIIWLRNEDEAGRLADAINQALMPSPP